MIVWKLRVFPTTISFRGGFQQGKTKLDSEVDIKYLAIKMDLLSREFNQEFYFNGDIILTNSS